MIKQLHCTTKTLPNTDLTLFKTLFHLDRTFTSLTVDFQDMYYHLPRTLIPDGAFCLNCLKMYEHEPTCENQKINNMLYMTVEECHRRQMNNCDTLIHEDPPVSSHLYVSAEEYRRRGPKAKPKNTRPEDLRRTRFPNHVNITFVIHDLDGQRDPKSTYRARHHVSIKINNSSISWTSMPYNKELFEFIINETSTKLQNIVQFDVTDLHIQDLNMQYDIQRPIELVDIRRKAVSQRSIHDNVFILKEDHNVPVSEVQTMYAKSIVLKYYNTVLHIKYSFQIYHTGIIQVSISKCQKRDVPRICNTTSPVSLFSWLTFDIDNEVKTFLDILNDFFDFHVNYDEQRHSSSKSVSRSSSSSKSVSRSSSLFYISSLDQEYQNNVLEFIDGRWTINELRKAFRTLYKFRSPTTDIVNALVPNDSVVSCLISTPSFSCVVDVFGHARPYERDIPSREDAWSVADDGTLLFRGFYSNGTFFIVNDRHVIKDDQRSCCVRFRAEDQTLIMYRVPHVWCPMKIHDRHSIGNRRQSLFPWKTKSVKEIGTWSLFEKHVNGTITLHVPHISEPLFYSDTILKHIIHT